MVTVHCISSAAWLLGLVPKGSLYVVNIYLDAYLKLVALRGKFNMRGAEMSCSFVDDLVLQNCFKKRLLDKYYVLRVPEELYFATREECVY